MATTDGNLALKPDPDEGEDGSDSGQLPKQTNPKFPAYIQPVPADDISGEKSELTAEVLTASKIQVDSVSKAGGKVKSQLRLVRDQSENPDVRSGDVSRGGLPDYLRLSRDEGSPSKLPANLRLVSSSPSNQERTPVGTALGAPVTDNVLGSTPGNVQPPIQPPEQVLPPRPQPEHSPEPPELSQQGNEFIDKLEQQGGAGQEDELSKLRKGQRPSAKFIFDKAEQFLPQYKWAIKLIRKFIKIAGTSEEEIADAIWKPKVPIIVYLAAPPESCIKNADIPKLLQLVGRIVFRLLLILTIINFLVWATFTLLTVVSICYIVKNGSFFNPTEAGVKVVAWVTGFTDICNKLDIGGTGGGASNTGAACPPTVERKTQWWEIKTAAAQSSCYTGPIGIGQWKDLINKYSEPNNLDPCILNTLIAKESKPPGNPNSIGHDAHSGSEDPFQPNSPPKYGLNWIHSHGIGLTQLTIFPDGNINGGKWPNPSIPQRHFSNTWYGLAQLLDPDTNLSVAAKYFASLLKQAGGNLQDAFRRYNGSGDQAEKYGADAMLRYRECKLQPNQT